MRLKLMMTMAVALVMTHVSSSTASDQHTVIISRSSVAEEIGQREVSFVARDLETGTRYELAGSDLDARHAPWSTFKIPHFLIALEEGVISDVDAMVRWEPNRRPALGYWPNSWRRDQSLRTAFERSAVWFFRDVALQIDARTYREILARWGYGNAAVPEGSDRFWLNEDLAISANEQITFLERLISGDFEVSSAAIAALLDASLAGQVNGLALHGKTGSGPVNPGNFSGPFEGWYAGFVIRPDARPIVFALHTQGPNFRSIRTFREDFARQLLIEVELLPTAFQP